MTLGTGSQDWLAYPQLVSREQLVRYDGIALKANWIDYLINLAATLIIRKLLSLGVDKPLSRLARHGTVGSGMT